MSDLIPFSSKNEQMETACSEDKKILKDDKEHCKKLIECTKDEGSSNSMSPFISIKLDEFLANSSTLNIPYLEGINPNIIPLPPDAPILSLEKSRKRFPQSSCKNETEKKLFDIKSNEKEFLVKKDEKGIECQGADELESKISSVFTSEILDKFLLNPGLNIPHLYEYNRNIIPIPPDAPILSLKKSNSSGKQ